MYPRHVLYVGIGIATLGVALLQLPFLSDRPRRYRYHCMLL